MSWWSMIGRTNFVKCTRPDIISRFPIRTFCARALLTFGVLSTVFACHTAAEQTKAKKVLVLFTSFSDYHTEFLAEIEPLIRTRVPGQIIFHEAYLENSHLVESSQKIQAEFFRRKYAEAKPDLVITSHPDAFYFAVRYRNKIFPGVPIVFTNISTRELEGQKMWPGVTGLTVPVGLRETIDLALHLHPDA